MQENITNGDRKPSATDSGVYFPASDNSCSHLLLICIYVERLAFELQFGHLVPVQEKSAAVGYTSSERQQKATASLNIHDKHFEIT